jgi:hypothetical protein
MYVFCILLCMSMYLYFIMYVNVSKRSLAHKHMYIYSRLCMCVWHIYANLFCSKPFDQMSMYVNSIVLLRKIVRELARFDVCAFMYNTHVYM